MAELLDDAPPGVPLTLVTITGGDTVTQGERGEKRVPKRDLASVVQVCLQGERLHIAEALPLARSLTDELVNFRVKVSLVGHDSYGGGAEWRDGNRDDPVPALALALQHGENWFVPGIWIVDECRPRVMQAGVVPASNPPLVFPKRDVPGGWQLRRC